MALFTFQIVWWITTVVENGCWHSRGCDIRAATYEARNPTAAQIWIMKSPFQFLISLKHCRRTSTVTPWPPSLLPRAGKKSWGLQLKLLPSKLSFICINFMHVFQKVQDSRLYCYLNWARSKQVQKPNEMSIRLAEDGAKNNNCKDNG